MKQFTFSIPVTIREENPEYYWSAERSVDITIEAKSLDEAMNRFANNFSKALKAFND